MSDAMIFQSGLPVKKKEETIKKWAKEAQACRENPGLWGLVAPNVNVYAVINGMRGDRYAAFKPASEFSFAMRNSRIVDGTRMGDVWVRYNGASE